MNVLGFQGNWRGKILRLASQSRSTILGRGINFRATISDVTVQGPPPRGRVPRYSEVECGIAPMSIRQTSVRRQLDLRG